MNGFQGSLAGPLFPADSHGPTFPGVAVPYRGPALQANLSVPCSDWLP